MTLNQRQRARIARMAAIGALTGEIAHYLRNNLAVAYGNLQLLAEGDEQFLHGKYDQMMSDALTATERNVVLTTTLSELSINNTEEVEVLDANQVARDFANLARIALGTDRAVELNLAEGRLLVAVRGGELTACLLFLLLNARTAMPSSGTLAIASNVLDQGATAVIAVTDSGCGMTPDVQARATEMFFTTGDPEQASGLGLSVVRDFADSAGGELRIDSAAGEGTTVSISLPLVS